MRKQKSSRLPLRLFVDAPRECYDLSASAPSALARNTLSSRPRQCLVSLNSESWRERDDAVPRGLTGWPSGFILAADRKA